MILAVLIDRVGLNGFVIGSASGDTAEEATAALKARTVGKEFRSGSDGWIEMTADLFDYLERGIPIGEPEEESEEYDPDAEDFEGDLLDTLSIETFVVGDLDNFRDPL